jgi:hypothetical protein
MAITKEWIEFCEMAASVKVTEGGSYVDLTKEAENGGILQSSMFLTCS